MKIKLIKEVRAILSLGLKEAKEMVDVFLLTDFEGGRHQKRVEKISCS